MSIKNRCCEKSSEGKTYLFQIRRRLKISQQTMAKLLLTTTQSVSSYETGKTKPQFPAPAISRLEKVLSLVGLTVQDIPPNPYDDIFEYSRTRDRSNDNLEWIEDYIKNIFEDP